MRKADGLFPGLRHFSTGENAFPKQSLAPQVVRRPYFTLGTQYFVPLRFARAPNNDSRPIYASRRSRTNTCARAGFRSWPIGARCFPWCRGTIGWAEAAPSELQPAPRPTSNRDGLAANRFRNTSCTAASNQVFHRFHHRSCRMIRRHLLIPNLPLVRPLIPRRLGETNLAPLARPPRAAYHRLASLHLGADCYLHLTSLHKFPKCREVTLFATMPPLPTKPDGLLTPGRSFLRFRQGTKQRLPTPLFLIPVCRDDQPMCNLHLRQSTPDSTAAEPTRCQSLASSSPGCRSGVSRSA